MIRARVITIPLALAFGVAAAWAWWPRWSADRALTEVASTVAVERDAGWRWWLAADGPTGAVRAEDALDALARRLAGASDAALRDGADRLRSRDLWEWSRLPASLILRDLALRAGAPRGDDLAVTADALLAVPLDVDPDRVRPVVETLLASEDEAVRDTAFAAACGFAGPERLEWLESLSIPPEATGLHRRRRLARDWPGPDRGPDADAAAAADLDRNLPAPGPADEDGEVYAAALRAERGLEPAAAAAQAERWIRSFDDDEKRAGALLAALRTVRGDLLERALDLEDVAAVRTTQRLALWAMGRRPDGAAEREFAHRALRHPGGDFRADTVLCMLRAGRAGALAFVTTPPPTAGGAALRRRAWLVARFVPEWHAAVGPPPRDAAAARQHFDYLEARRLLVQRRLRFDPESATYAERRR